MKKEEMREVVDRFLASWNGQDVQEVLDCYTADLVYRDPNTRGAVEGAEAMRRYLTKLFAAWTMTWKCRELVPFKEVEGAAVLWRATIRRAGGKEQVEIDGMDLAVLRGGKLARNEVYFDRALLVPLLGPGK